MGYEYLLFAAGAVLIFAALFLTYRVEKKDGDNFYLESEMLSEIRGLKQEIKEGLETDDFKKVLEEEQLGNNSPREIKIIKNSINELTAKLDSIEGGLVRLENKIDKISTGEGSTAATKKIKGDFKPKKYQKIKELSKNGNSVSEIAQELDMGNREVELIKKLNERRES